MKIDGFSFGNKKSVSEYAILIFRNDNKIQIGQPFLENSKIPAKIIQQVKGKKITVLKTKPKKRYTRTRGHRQAYTRVQIDSI